MGSVMKDAELHKAVANFLKNVSQTAEGEIVKSLKRSIAAGRIKGHETFTAAVNFSSEKIDLHVTIYSKIDL